MDGAKHITDTPEVPFMGILVSRRSYCAEVSLKGVMERYGVKILVLVRSDYLENR